MIFGLDYLIRAFRAAAMNNELKRQGNRRRSNPHGAGARKGMAKWRRRTFRKSRRLMAHESRRRNLGMKGRTKV